MAMAMGMGLCTEGAIIMSKKTIGMAMAMAMAMGLCIEGAIIMSKKTIGNGNGNGNGNVLHNACLQIRIFWKRPPSPARKGDCFSYNPIRITFLFCVFCRFFFWLSCGALRWAWQWQWQWGFVLKGRSSGVILGL